jgi:hypothetical protein
MADVAGSPRDRDDKPVFKTEVAGALDEFQRPGLTLGSNGASFQS